MLETLQVTGEDSFLNPSTADHKGLPGLPFGSVGVGNVSIEGLFRDLWPQAPGPLNSLWVSLEVKGLSKKGVGWK